MKATRVVRWVALLAACALAGGILSTVATYAVWNTAVEPRALRCVDDIGIFDSYWCDIDNHRAAGDTVLPGWTWEKLKLVRIIFITAFYLLWAGGALAFFRMAGRKIPRPNVLEAKLE